MSESNIHPTAIISKDAQIGDDVKVGPFCVIKGDVKIGKGCIIESHVSIGTDFGEVRIGENNHFWPGAVVGGAPQDLKYKDEKTKLHIGNNNTIREYVTLNLGTAGGGGLTKIGNNCLLMAYVHIAHDCELGNNIVVSNSTQFAGHVVAEDFVRIGGICAISQFCRLGTYAFIAGDSTVNKDILPYTMAYGRWATMRATNKIGLERAGFDKAEVQNIHKAVRSVIKGHRTIEDALKKIQEDCEPTEALEHFVNFLKSSERGVAR